MKSFLNFINRKKIWELKETFYSCLINRRVITCSGFSNMLTTFLFNILFTSGLALFHFSYFAFLWFFGLLVPLMRPVAWVLGF